MQLNKKKKKSRPINLFHLSHYSHFVCPNSLGLLHGLNSQ